MRCISSKIKVNDASVRFGVRLVFRRNSIQIERLARRLRRPNTAKPYERLTDPSETDVRPVTSVLGAALLGASPH
jgi:hypothetical protein